MSKTNYLFVLLSICLLEVRQTVALYCGTEFCSGDADSCCYNDDYDYVCCTNDLIVGTWWLWFIIVLVGTIIACFVGCCYRIRRRNARYVVITGERPIISSNTRTIYPVYGACYPEDAAPVLVRPVYATSNGQQYPPPYTAAVENKGNPPSYTPRH